MSRTVLLDSTPLGLLSAPSFRAERQSMLLMACQSAFGGRSGDCPRDYRLRSSAQLVERQSEECVRLDG